MNLLYKIIYHPAINKAIRNLSLLFVNFLPSKFRISPSGKLKIVIDKHHGSFVLKTNQTSYISRELFWDGSLDFEYTPIFIGLVKKVSVFFDIGANIGYYSILGSTVNSKLTTHAFEPAIGARTYLLENVKSGTQKFHEASSGFWCVVLFHLGFAFLFKISYFIIY